MTDVITHYTTEEGGEWKELDRKVTLEDLRLDGVRDACRKQGQRTGTLGGMAVHSIRFSNGREWDVVNGWRP